MNRAAFQLVVALVMAVRAGADDASPASPATALMYEEPKLLTGSIYAKKGDRTQPLFTFKRTATRSGSRLTVSRVYAYPDGKAAARESVIYDGNDLASYQLEELQMNSSGSAKVRRQANGSGTIAFEYSPEGRAARTANEALQKTALIDDMIGPFVSSHWPELAKGEKVKCRYIVVPRKETVGFTFTKDGDSTRQGKATTIIKMEATSPIIAALVDPIYFTVESQSPHHILEYVGRTTPKVRAGHGWDDVDAVTVFHWESK